jgi:dynein heavy chain, axonemal
LALPADAAPPDGESVYEWMFDQETQKWVDWMETCPPFQCNPDTPFAEIMVPTADTIRYTFVMRRLLLAGHNVLAVGETGTGKTLAVQVLP